SPKQDCGPDTINCGGIFTETCCPSGWTCNFSSGVPLCSKPGTDYVNGYSHSRCSDPDLFACSITDEASSTCSLGTICHTDAINRNVYCIDAVGITALAVPSATTIGTPPASAVPGSDVAITYSPPQAWSVSEENLGCTTNPSLHITNEINATISFNYTGDVIVHTLMSPRGGRFGVMIDGFDTRSNVDTYLPENSTDSACFAVQFPPMLVVPPGFEHRENHSITLFYKGPSRKPELPINDSFVQFDSFSIPIFDPQRQSIVMNSAFSHRRMGNFGDVLFWLGIVYFLAAMLL
ncbi:hypothetical protein FA15DRAFT_592424, partial [Coprinopsis marcescibilis]